jgi:hypothetical protein
MTLLCCCTLIVVSAVSSGCHELQGLPCCTLAALLLPHMYCTPPPLLPLPLPLLLLLQAE